MRTPVLLLVAPVVCLAQASPAPSASAPHISFDATHFDFGKIPGDAKVTHRFKVTNTGRDTLNITRLNPSCGCTSTVLGKWSLAPSESTEIEVTFNPSGFRGLSRKSIQVISDDPAQSSATLTFQAEVVREIMPSTDSVFFQDVVRTANRKASIKLTAGTDRPVKITELRAPGAPYLALASRQEGNDAWVDVTLQGAGLPASKQLGLDRVFVRTSNSKVPPIQIDVQWELRASVVADPIRVAWAGDAAGQELRSPVVLKQVDNKPFRILSSKISSPLIQLVGLDKAAAAKHDLEVVLSADARPGNYNEKITLTLDDPNQPTLELRVSALLH